jgi:alpha-1,6-mannosyltransferase
LPTLALLVLALSISAIFYHIGRTPDLKTYVPEFIALALGAGVLYVIGVYLVERFEFGRVALAVILGSALAIRLVVLPASLSISTDAFRYQWEGRVQRAGINPYATNPTALHHAFEDPEHPLETGAATPTLYPPLSEFSFAWVKTIPDYKRLYTGLDVASIVVLLLLLAIRKQPLQRVLAYAWNPTVVISFALCGHHDALAILTLLGANLFIINQRWALSILFLALSALSKFFAVLLVPVFLQRTRWIYAGLFAVVVILAYVPYASAGWKLLDGLSQYSAGWENNDSLFRLLLLAGNSKPQAGLVAGILIAGLMAFVLKKRMEPLRASLFLLAGLLLLSPNAFPWYFSWTIPFVCFYPSAPWLLMSVTCVLGYAPLVAYSAGFAYKDSPLILALEYAPVLAWLIVSGVLSTAGSLRSSTTNA